MKVSVLKTRDYQSQPWKNGQGTTLQIAVDGEAPYRWRISSAMMVRDCEFSEFPGYQRHLVLLENGVVRLGHDNGIEKVLTALEPYTFSGDLKTIAKVASALSDFNVWTKRGEARASVYTMRLRQKERVDFPLRGDEHFIYCVEGELELLERNTNGSFRLSPGETLRITREPKKECLDLQAMGVMPSTFIWTVIHCQKARMKATPPKTLPKRKAL